MNTNVSHQDEKIKFDQIIQKNVPLAPFTTIKTGGIAKYFCAPGLFEELIAALEFANINKLKIYVIGAGSNLLISDKPIEGLVIRTSKLCRYSIRGNIFSCRSGLSLDRAINITQNDGMLGLEGLGGIPGSIGGAIYGNAGAYGYTISDRLLYVDYITYDGKSHRMDRGVEDFNYRDSPFKHMEKVIIFEAGFILDKNKYSTFAKQVKDNNTKNRITKGLLAYPSAGSIFKNPKNNIAGKLIEESVSKDITVNDAIICPSHANYIMNKGHATSSDIYKLSQICKESVKAKFDIDLEYEVQLLGDFS
jgi:UDP-N-acetylmuramate dehydrogenase